MRCWLPSLPWVLFILTFPLIIAGLVHPPYQPSTKDIRIYAPNAVTNMQSRALALHPNQRISLSPRDYGYQNFLNLGGGWNLYYSSWPALIFPVQPAVWALRRLYHSMEVNAGSIWRLSAPRYEIPLTLGNVFLLMESDQPIEWDLVMMFGKKLLDYTDEGFTGLYRLMLSHAQNQVTIFVTLKVIER